MAAAPLLMGAALLLIVLLLSLVFLRLVRRRSGAGVGKAGEDGVTDRVGGAGEGSPMVDEAAAGTSRQVLIVDDDPVTRATLHRLFSQAGFASEEVEDGQMAVELYEQGRRFDMVVMDHEMPVLNGVDTVKALRKFDRDVTIMALTSQDPTSKEKDFLRVGANFVAPKPVTRHSLKEVLKQYELIKW